MAEALNLPPGSIFLSYRRDDSGDVTGRIYDWLGREFPGGAVFRDVDSIPFGVDFREHLRQVLEGCRVVLVVIGRQWADIRDATGARRLDNPADYVRIEVETALAKSGLRVIPILVGGATLPKEGEMPESLQSLLYRNGPEVRRDPDFVHDIDRLVKQLRVALLGPPTQSNPRGSTPTASRILLTPPPLPPPTSRGHSTHAGSRAATKDLPLVNSLGMKFVPVPGTDVLFCIHPTRKRDYRKYADAKAGVGDSWKNVSRDGVPVSEGEDHPVVEVSWEDGKAFCAWLSKKEGETYRLPTDHEWSCAVGIGNHEDAQASPASKDGKIKDLFPWGTQWPPPKGAGNFADTVFKEKFPHHPGIEGYTDGFATTSPVMSFEPNKLGLYDMAGNVWEWCENWYAAENKHRVMRGGAWDFNARGFLLSSFRGLSEPAYRDDLHGFRVVRVVGDGG